MGRSAPSSQDNPGEDCGWGHPVQADSKTTLLSRDKKQKLVRCHLHVQVCTRAHTPGAPLRVKCARVYLLMFCLWPSDGANGVDVFSFFAELFEAFKFGKLCIP